MVVTLMTNFRVLDLALVDLTDPMLAADPGAYHGVGNERFDLASIAHHCDFLLVACGFGEHA